MKTTILNLCYLFFCVALISCEKEDETNNQSSSEKKLIGNWTVIKKEKKENGESWAEITQSCILDDTETFLSNKGWSLHSGTIKCEANERESTTGTWSLNESGTKITFTYTIASGEYVREVEKLTDNELIISHNSNNTSQTWYRTTYKK